MSTERGYLEFSDDEIKSGLQYAREKENVELSALVLRLLANETRQNMAKGKNFEDARFQTLMKHMKQRDPQEVKEREGYSHAIAHMHGMRSGWVRKKKPNIRPSKKRSGKAGISINDKGQVEWIL